MRLCVDVRHLRSAPRPDLLALEGFEKLSAYLARDVVRCFY